MDKLTTIQKHQLAILEEKPKISSYKEEVKNTRLLGLIDYLLNLLGVNQIEQKDGQWLALAEFIKTDYSNYTFEEIVHAFKMFIKRELWLEKWDNKTKDLQKEQLIPFQQLNSLVFVQVMEAFENHKKEKLFDYKQNLNKKELPQMTESQKEEIVVNGLIDAFKIYKNTKRMKEVCSHYYDYLDEKGILSLTLEEKNKVFYYAKKTLEFELKDKKAITKSEHDEIQRILKIGIPKDSVVAFAKKTALKNYFDELIKSNINIETLIK